MKMPLVSILIPTYNRPIYFKQALLSAVLQTYPSIEIIICDDSTNDDTKKIALRYIEKFPGKIKYYKNQTNIGGRLNFQLAFQRATGEYINYLMDDDLFHHHKIERMMKYFLSDHTNIIKLVTSYRQPIDAEGKNIPDFTFTKKRFDFDTIVSGSDAGNSILLDGNWIGEPTTVLFRKRDLVEPFGQFCGTQYFSAVDMASWFSLLSNGNLVYIADTLSYLRMHPSNLGKNIDMRINAFYDWMHMTFHCPLYKFLEHPNHLFQRLKLSLQVVNDLEVLYSNQISTSKRKLLLFYKQCLQKYLKKIQLVIEE
ncbi:glycosyltransferase [Bacillus cereus group sp. N6]|uniref:glycosyltransferase family 2 protein n=1 Tax=Bacillus cereus group sp. N6 TaxID=2794583 RepID=UPI0018F45662|nr:glycosyltransferase [Bacillus cereus group sp. N6]MBJ8113121.1 glycosyltransferase [Bacillus cereus group sp. N6]